MRAQAGPTGAGDTHAARPTGFPGAYLDTVDLSVKADPLYASSLLDALQMHLYSVTVMTSPRAVGDYLGNAVLGTFAGGGDAELRLGAVLGKEALDAPKASALLIADALARPDQFREILEGLETLKSGLGRHSAAILRKAKGPGDPKLLKALRAAGEAARRGKPEIYWPAGAFERLFDGSPAAPPAPASRSQNAGRTPSPRLD